MSIVKLLIAMTSVGLASCTSINEPLPAAAVPLVGTFPRFPHDPAARVRRDVMVFYSPDDISSKITWDYLGYPAGGFFRIHRAFPRLKVTMQTVPANRYLEIPEPNVLHDPVAMGIWKDLSFRSEFTSWLEFGNHGYFHSPDGDPNLDHHEFDALVNPRASDSGFCYGTFSRARETYAAAGLDNDRITVMRFPGEQRTPMALEALADHGFLGFFEFHPGGRIIPHPLKGKREILAIPEVSLLALTESPRLRLDLQSGAIDSAGLKTSDAYRQALAQAMLHLEALARDGGIINIFDHWWEHSREHVNGIHWRFHLFADMLDGLDDTFGDRIWWGFGSELARWEHIRRNASVTVIPVPEGAEVFFQPPARWKAAWAMEIGYSLQADAPRAGTAPVVTAAAFTLASENHAVEHPLGPDRIWSDSHGIHFNLPLAEPTRVRLSFRK